MKELITNLSFLYEIDPVTMADIIRTTLNEKGNINIENNIKINKKIKYGYKLDFFLG